MQRTPWHYWPIVTLAVAWHLLGTIDYTATLVDWTPWMTLLSDGQAEIIACMPAWAVTLWAVSVWGGLAGALLMWVRAGAAPVVLSLSAFATVGAALWATLGLDAATRDTLAGPFTLTLLWCIAAFTLALWLYARDMHKTGVL